MRKHLATNIIVTLTFCLSPAFMQDVLAEKDGDGAVNNKSLQKQERIMICHEGMNKIVALPAVTAHLAHGDSLGRCDGLVGISPEEYQRLVDSAVEDIPNLPPHDINKVLPRSLMEPQPHPTEPPSTSAGVLRDVIASIEALITEGSTYNANTPESLVLALSDLRSALGALTAPPDEHAMVSGMLRAFEDIETAMEMQEINSVDGEEIMLRLTVLAKDVVSDAIDDAIAQEVDSEVITEAQIHFEAGIRHLSSNKLSDAAREFLSVLSLRVGYVFDLDRFEENIINQVEFPGGGLRVVGYGYAINKDGIQVRAGGEGWARIFLTPHGANKPQEVASVSKTITATAVLKLLSENYVSVDSSVINFLPASWDP
ncbi:MAG: beta-lactamase family protein, partial [Gammaproteobacteria bacterium]|nr:beta-lactamase family protein [Gammaproteobacteria bacterium]